MPDTDAPHQSEWLRNLAGGARWARALPLAAILAATFLSYVATLALGYVADDQTLIITNDAIRSWRYFPSYFSSHIWSYHYPHLLANYYRPLFLTWLRLNDGIFGLHPWGWHLTSVLAHVAVTYLVYRLCLRLTEDYWVAGAAGLIFGLHPVHVEAIANVASAQDPLSTFFTLGALLAFRRSRESELRFRWIAASLGLFATALLFKENTLIAPILVGGYAWIYGGAGGGEVTPGECRFSQRLGSALGASLPFWIVILIYLPLRIHALKGFAHVATPLSLFKEVCTLPSVLLFYLRLLIWPSALSYYYDTPYVSTPSWHDFVLPAVMLAMVAAALAFWYERTRRSAPEEAKAIAFGCMWMVLTLLPVLNFRFLLEGEIAHDRYLYLPSVGFALVVAVALRQAAGGAPGFFRKPAGALLGVLVLSGVMGIATARQCLFWKDDLILSVRAHSIAPHNVTATTSLAAAVAQQGMDGQAMALYEQALAIQPDFWVANRNLAYLYFNHGDFPETVHFLSRSLAAGPEDGDQFLILGLALLRMGRLTEAEKAVRAALLLRPLGKNYHIGLGMVLRGEGRLPEAKREIEVELSHDAQNAQARTLLKEVTWQMQAQGEGSSATQGPKGRSGDIK